MSYVERMGIILSAIFGKTLDATFLRSVMVAFADGMPLDGLTEDEIAEAICRYWIDSAKTEMIETVKAHNRALAMVAADAATATQLQILNEQS